MPPQNRSRSRRPNLPFQTQLDRARLAHIRHDSDNLPRLQNLPRRHRDRARGHLRQIRKPALTHLLSATSLVQFNNDVRILGLKIRGRIIERNMPVLPDADERQIDRRRRQLSRHFVNGPRQIGSIPLHEMKIHNSRFPHHPLQQKFPKARRMTYRQPDILIQMKSLNLLPVDPCRPRQGFQESKLRVACRKNDPATTALSSSAPDRRSSLLRRHPRQRLRISEESDNHRAPAPRRLSRGRLARARRRIIQAISFCESRARRRHSDLRPIQPRRQRLHKTQRHHISRPRQHEHRHIRAGSL